MSPTSNNDGSSSSSSSLQTALAASSFSSAASRSNRTGLPRQRMRGGKGHRPTEDQDNAEDDGDGDGDGGRGSADPNPRIGKRNDHPIRGLGGGRGGRGGEVGGGEGGGGGRRRQQQQGQQRGQQGRRANPRQRHHHQREGQRGRHQRQRQHQHQQHQRPHQQQHQRQHPKGQQQQQRHKQPQPQPQPQPRWRDGLDAPDAGGDDLPAGLPSPPRGGRGGSRRDDDLGGGGTGGNDGSDQAGSRGGSPSGANLVDLGGGGGSTNTNDIDDHQRHRRDRRNGNPDKTSRKEKKKKQQQKKQRKNDKSTAVIVAAAAATNGSDDPNENRHQNRQKPNHHRTPQEEEEDGAKLLGIGIEIDGRRLLDGGGVSDGRHEGVGCDEGAGGEEEGGGGAEGEGGIEITLSLTDSRVFRLQDETCNASCRRGFAIGDDATIRGGGALPTEEGIIVVPTGVKGGGAKGGGDENVATVATKTGDAPTTMVGGRGGSYYGKSRPSPRSQSRVLPTPLPANGGGSSASGEVGHRHRDGPTNRVLLPGYVGCHVASCCHTARHSTRSFPALPNRLDVGGGENGSYENANLGESSSGGAERQFGRGRQQHRVCGLRHSRGGGSRTEANGGNSSNSSTCGRGGMSCSFVDRSTFEGNGDGSIFSGPPPSSTGGGGGGRRSHHTSSRHREDENQLLLTYPPQSSATLQFERDRPRQIRQRTTVLPIPGGDVAAFELPDDELTAVRNELTRTEREIKALEGDRVSAELRFLQIWNRRRRRRGDPGEFGRRFDHHQRRIGSRRSRSMLLPPTLEDDDDVAEIWDSDLLLDATATSSLSSSSGAAAAAVEEEGSVSSLSGAAASVPVPASASRFRSGGGGSGRGRNWHGLRRNRNRLRGYSSNDGGGGSSGGRVHSSSGGNGADLTHRGADTDDAIGRGGYRLTRRERRYLQQKRGMCLTAHLDDTAVRAAFLSVFCPPDDDKPAEGGDEKAVDGRLPAAFAAVLLPPPSAATDSTPPPSRLRADLLQNVTDRFGTMAVSPSPSPEKGGAMFPFSAAGGGGGGGRPGTEGRPATTTASCVAMTSTASKVVTVSGCRDVRVLSLVELTDGSERRRAGGPSSPSLKPPHAETAPSHSSFVRTNVGFWMGKDDGTVFCHGDLPARLQERLGRERRIGSIGGSKRGGGGGISGGSRGTQGSSGRHVRYLSSGPLGSYYVEMASGECWWGVGGNDPANAEAFSHAMDGFDVRRVAFGPPITVVGSSSRSSAVSEMNESATCSASAALASKASAGEVVFVPWIILGRDGRSAWHSAIPSRLHRELSDRPPDRAAPVEVSLGGGGSYFVKYLDGEVDYCLPAPAAKVCAQIEERGGTITNIALHAESYDYVIRHTQLLSDY